ncbi:hypothetical protein CRG98_018381 [Punica granatum]|uniref:Uncharacterized protein n=1 Tax=Punica granatum TaxID=22663 RepID=A0A2I0JZI1_PUNGR|nr:hypothetical protein CRG98_018381 [Punica granatum]
MCSPKEMIVQSRHGEIWPWRGVRQTLIMAVLPWPSLSDGQGARLGFVSSGRPRLKVVWADGEGRRGSTTSRRLDDFTEPPCDRRDSARSP